MTSTSHISNPSSYKILVIDDVVDNFDLIQVILESEGYELDYADSGQEAFKKIENEAPDVILLDIMMPEMDGFEVARRLRQNSRFSKIPILFITAYDDINPPEEGLDNLGNGLLKKPIDFDELINQVQRASSKHNSKNLSNLW
ncbi:MAG: response regulator [Nostocaceae cyanobacterium]|nr:response regulator [Nostocaceae cyanobacterium]